MKLNAIQMRVKSASHPISIVKNVRVVQLLIWVDLHISVALRDENDLSTYDGALKALEQSLSNYHFMWTASCTGWISIKNQILCERKSDFDWEISMEIPFYAIPIKESLEGQCVGDVTIRFLIQLTVLMRRQKPSYLESILLSKHH